MYDQIRQDLTNLYLEDTRPWLVGFSGGKDSTMVASLIFRVVCDIPVNKRTKPVSIVCTDTRVEIPQIVSMIENTLRQMRQFSLENELNVDVNFLRPPAEQSYWVNIIGRGYPPPNRNFRWCTQRLKIDPVTKFVGQNIGHWGEAVLHLGARRAESATRAQTLASIDTKNGLRRHPDLPRVWVSNPIEYLSTEEVWAYLLQNSNPWGGNNRTLYKLYSDAGGGECPIQIDSSTPSCGNSRFGCWACTVIERDKASEGLLAAGDDRMEYLLDLRETLMHFRDPKNGKRDLIGMNGGDHAGPLNIAARRELLEKLLKLQEQVGLTLIDDEELLLIQQFWKSSRKPDDGRGVARIVNRIRGTKMNNLKETEKLFELQTKVCEEKEVCIETFRRLLAKVEEYTDSHRAQGLPDDLLNIIKDDLHNRMASKMQE